jgi:hypothetical protein
MKEVGQSLFGCIPPTYFTAHKNNRSRGKDAQQAIMLISAKAHPNDDLQAATTDGSQSLKAVFDERGRNRRRGHGKLARHNLKRPDHDPSTEVSSPLPCRVQGGLGAARRCEDTVDLEFFTEVKIACRLRNGFLQATGDKSSACGLCHALHTYPSTHKDFIKTAEISIASNNSRARLPAKLLADRQIPLPLRQHTSLLQGP